jgi:TolB-like protein/DNA-binding winged helix-turn-helix (wHTH) protein
MKAWAESMDGEWRVSGIILTVQALGTGRVSTKLADRRKSFAGSAVVDSGKHRGNPLEKAARVQKIRFGAFEVDLGSGELRKHGLRIKLQDQPFQVLVLLLGRSGAVVTREELRQRLWPAQAFVDFDVGLNTAIKRLRDALGDSAVTPRFVETLPRRGYRFIAATEEVPGSPVGRNAVETPAPGNAEAEGLSHPTESVAATSNVVQPKIERGWIKTTRWSYWFALGTAAVLLPLFLGLNLRGLRDRLLGRTDAGRIRSLAVLPLDNLSGDPSQEYFVDGMTDALITNLSKIGALRVISHTSVNHFKGTKKPLREIAVELQVDAVIEGSVEREADRVRITANLVQAFPEKHLWAESYDRELRSILDLESEVARTIADQIKITVTPEERRRLAVSQTVDPEAHELYLKGAFYNNKWTKEGFEKGIEYFNRALERDPRNARAYAELAVAYGGLGIYGDMEGYPRQKAASLKALEIDDTLGDAHTTLAWAKFTLDWDVAGAEEEFRRAIELNRGDARAHSWYGTFLAFRGRVEDSLREVKSARMLDPLSLANTSTAAFLAYYNARQYDNAIEVCREALDLDANFLPARQRLVRAYEGKGELGKAVDEQRRIAALAGKGSRMVRDVESLRKARAANGASGYWLQKLKLLEAEVNGRDAIDIGKTYSRLGNKDEAFRWLDIAFKQHLPYLIWDLPADPALDGLRSDPRYTDLLRRLVPRSE